MGSRRPRARATPLERRLPVAAAAALLALSFALYGPALQGEFVSDDINAIVANDHVRAPADPIAIFTTFSWWGTERGDAPGYRPLVTWSFAVSHALGGLEPSGYHAVNIVLHAVVSWLALMLGLAIGLGPAGASVAAIVFCVLPIHVEPVAWVVGRAELMAAAAFTGALLALLAYRRGASPLALALAAGLLAAGLFSKENAITLIAMPAVASLSLPSSKAARRRDLIATGVLAAVVALYFGVRAAAGPLLPAAAGDLLDNPLSAVSLPSRAAGALAVFGRYMALTVWPRRLSVDYSYDALGIGPGFVGDAYAALGLAVASGLAVAAWRQRHHRPAVTFSVLLVAVTYSIVSNTLVLIGTVMGERLFYLPSLGLCLLAGAASESTPARIPDRARWALAASVIVALAIVSVTRVPDWSTPITLFEAAVRAHPRSARAHMELGSAYGHSDRVQDAEAALRDAVEILPEYAAAWYNLGNLYVRNARYDDAVDAYRDALEHRPGLVQAWYNLGLTERIRGHAPEAEAALREATERAPLDPAPAAALGDVLLGVGRYDPAIDAYTLAVARGTQDPGVYINRGVALQRARGCEAAVDDYLAAERLAPGNRTAVVNAVACLERLGRGEEASSLRARVANRGTGG